jgi:hypothetical protein
LLFDARIETASVRQLHDQVALPFELIERIDVDDVGVIERSAGARFTVETLQRDGVILQLFPHQLDRHHAFENGVKRAINLPVPAGSDFAAQLKLAQLHGHHDRVAATLAGLGGQRREVPRDEDLGIAPAAGDHFQRLIARTHTIQY